MSSITFGPPVVLDGPLPVAPTRSLLTVDGVLQRDTTNSKWMNGIAVYGYPDTLPDVWDPCSTGTYETKSDASSWQTPEFGAFVAYIPVTCTAFSLASDPQGFAQRAEIALNARISYPLEAALAKGVPMSLNPYMGDANVDILASGAAVSPEKGLAWLEEAIGATGVGGLIHATPGVVARWFATFPLTEPTSPLYTPAGTPVSCGGGYQGAQPFGGAAPSSGKEWAWATGPVQAWLADEATLNIEDVLDRSNNDVTFRAEKYALVEWDTSLQAAVLIDWGA